MKSPNASKIQDWQIKKQTHSPSGEVHSHPFCNFSQLFSDLASEDTKLLASLACVMKTYSHPCIMIKPLEVKD
jgi:hypothetical protein